MEEGLGTAMRPSLGEGLWPTSPELWDTMEKKTTIFATDGLFFWIKILWKPFFVPIEKRTGSFPIHRQGLSLVPD